MDDDSRTVILTRQIAKDAGLTDEDADIIAERTKENTAAVKRFEALEVEIDKVKRVARWLGALLLANYSGNILDWLTR